ncbi:MAG: F0F1 ATP synthase subunit B [Chloroflexi bacterium]|nr:F0F1 ATP synthase subunit B [Chloroflexota bacterium]
MEALGINLPLLIAQIVCFGGLLAILWRFAYKPVMNMLDARSEKIEESLAAGEIVVQQAREAEIAYKEKIKEAAAQSQIIIDRASKTGEEIRLKAIEEAKEEAAIVVSRAREEITREKEETISALRKEYADLVALAASKVIGKSLDKKAHEALIDDVLAESISLRKN